MRISTWSSGQQGQGGQSRIVCSGSTWSTGFNKLCGINPDQHFYIHLDKHVRYVVIHLFTCLQVGFQHVDFTITSLSKNIPYKFGLWITQIDCFDGSSVMAPGEADKSQDQEDDFLPPGGCSQYHFGMEGIIKSFNFEGVQYLNNQNYKSCIRYKVDVSHLSS